MSTKLEEIENVAEEALFFAEKAYKVYLDFMRSETLEELGIDEPFHPDDFFEFTHFRNGVYTLNVYDEVKKSGLKKEYNPVDLRKALENHPNNPRDFSQEMPEKVVSKGEALEEVEETKQELETAREQLDEVAKEAHKTVTDYSVEDVENLIKADALEEKTIEEWLVIEENTKERSTMTEALERELGYLGTGEDEDSGE